MRLNTLGRYNNSVMLRRPTSPDPNTGQIFYEDAETLKVRIEPLVSAVTSWVLIYAQELLEDNVRWHWLAYPDGSLIFPSRFVEAPGGYEFKTFRRTPILDTNGEFVENQYRLSVYAR